MYHFCSNVTRTIFFCGLIRFSIKKIAFLCKYYFITSYVPLFRIIIFFLYVIKLKLNPFFYIYFNINLNYVIPRYLIVYKLRQFMKDIKLHKMPNLFCSN